MSFMHTYDLAKATGFRPKVIIAMVRVAGQVAVEDRSTMQPSRAEKRHSLASLVLRQPELQAEMFIWSTLANPVIAAAGLDAVDGDIEYQVTQVFDALAGVSADELESI